MRRTLLFSPFPPAQSQRRQALFSPSVFICVHLWLGNKDKLVGVEQGSGELLEALGFDEGFGVF